MRLTSVEKSARAIAVALVASVGLLASTPNVHGTADSRGGGAVCDANKTLSKLCGDTGYSGKCLYSYTTCYSVDGWRYMTCVKKPMANNQCEKDVARCFPRDDFMAVAACTPSYQAAAAAAAVAPGRSSEVQ